MSFTYRVQLIPPSRPQRPGYRIAGGRPSSLTVHTTANPNATAANHADYFAGSDLKASAHIFVDDKEAVLTILLNEQAWHAGTDAGNTTSIGIEVCEFSDRARAEAAEANAQRLICEMLMGTAPPGFQTPHLSINQVRTHQSWMQYGTSGKYCPRTLLPWWDTFVAGIKTLMYPAPTAPAPADAVVLFHAASDVVMAIIAKAWGKGFAGYPHQGGEKYVGGLSHEDSLNYIPKGASVEEKFPNPDGLFSVGAVHCSMAYAREIKAFCDDRKLACTIHPEGPHHVGYPTMTAALAAGLSKGISFPAVFGEA